MRMFKKFKLRFFNTESEKKPVIINNSKKIIDNRSLNERLLNEMFLELYGED